MMRIIIPAILALAWPAIVMATPYEPEDDPAGHVPSIVRNVYVDDDAARAAISADEQFVSMMRMHHQGAVTMAEDYLADPQGRHPIIRKLADAIIANQQFEIAVLDDIGRRVAQPPRKVAGKAVERQAGWDGLEHTWQFVKHPPPGVVDLWLDDTPMSERDVVFAKGMIIHHQAAVEMARDFNADPAADNLILKAMNRDIVIDQNYEIRLLERLIDRYPGNAAAIVVDPASIPGMPHHGDAGMSTGAPTDGGGSTGMSPHGGH